MIFWGLKGLDTSISLDLPSVAHTACPVGSGWLIPHNYYPWQSSYHPRISKMLVYTAGKVIPSSAVSWWLLSLLQPFSITLQTPDLHSNWSCPFTKGLLDSPQRFQPCMIPSSATLFDCFTPSSIMGETLAYYQVPSTKRRCSFVSTLDHSFCVMTLSKYFSGLTSVMLVSY